QLRWQPPSGAAGLVPADVLFHEREQGTKALSRAADAPTRGEYLPHRRLASWALSLGGKFAPLEGRTRPLDQAEVAQLPEGNFTLGSLNLSGGRAVSPEGAKQLFRRISLPRLSFAGTAVGDAANYCMILPLEELSLARAGITDGLFTGRIGGDSPHWK